MKYANSELEVIGQVVADAHQGCMNELNELHLALVGGGIADVVLA